MNIDINYKELSFIMNIPQTQAKAVFCKILGLDKVKIDLLINSSDFRGVFGQVRSVDYRYDNKDKFEFYLDQCKLSYKKYLNDKQFIKTLVLPSKLSIFSKILDKEELKFMSDVVEYKHKYLFGK
jgi:hypothetical protein